MARNIVLSGRTAQLGPPGALSDYGAAHIRSTERNRAGWRRVRWPAVAVPRRDTARSVRQCGNAVSRLTGSARLCRARHHGNGRRHMGPKSADANPNKQRTPAPVVTARGGDMGGAAVCPPADSAWWLVVPGRCAGCRVLSSRRANSVPLTVFRKATVPHH